MNKAYHYMVNVHWSEEDRCFIAEAPELEGCMTYAKTADRAVKKAPAAIASWIAAAKKLGHPIPAPLFTRPVSGKFNVRLPKELHRALVSRAIQEGVSLNQLVTTLLAHAV